MPQIFGGQFQYIANKARNILEQRSIEEIQFGLKTINWIYFESEQAYIEGMLIMVGKDDATFYITPTVVLASQIDKFDITKQVDFPRAQWEEYFAILALALIGNAVNYEKIEYPHLRLTKKEIEKQKRDSIGDALADAMEAVCYAESILSKNEILKRSPELIDESLNSQIRLRNQQAAIARHEPKNYIKRQFVKFYKKGQYKVFAFAVKEFYKALTGEERKEICDTDKEIDKQIRNLARTLKRYIKNESIQLDDSNTSNQLKSA